MKCELENSGTGGQKTEGKKCKTVHIEEKRSISETWKGEKNQLLRVKVWDTRIIHCKIKTREEYYKTGCQQRIRNEVKDGRRFL